MEKQMYHFFSEHGVDYVIMSLGGCQYAISSWCPNPVKSQRLMHSVLQHLVRLTEHLIKY